MSVWRNDIKCKYMFMFPLKKLACKELINGASVTLSQMMSGPSQPPQQEFLSSSDEIFTLNLCLLHHFRWQSLPMRVVAWNETRCLLVDETLSLSQNLYGKHSQAGMEEPQLYPELWVHGIKHFMCRDWVFIYFCLLRRYFVWSYFPQNLSYKNFSWTIYFFVEN